MGDGTCLVQSKAGEYVDGLRKGPLPWLLLPGPCLPSLAPGSLQGYLGPQTMVLQVELWGAPLVQKAGSRHDAVGPARPQVEGVLAQFSKLMGA